MNGHDCPGWNPSVTRVPNHCEGCGIDLVPGEQVWSYLNSSGAMSLRKRCQRCGKGDKGPFQRKYFPMTPTEKRRIIDAWHTAYAEQERRTCDPYVKKAVRDALSHMKALALGEAYTPPSVTMKDVTRMRQEIMGAADQYKKVEDALAELMKWFSTHTNVTSSPGPTAPPPVDPETAKRIQYAMAHPETIVLKEPLKPADILFESSIKKSMGLDLGKKPREPGCQCHQEEGDSPCPVHGDEECQGCGELFIKANGHVCMDAPVVDK